MKVKNATNTIQSIEFIDGRFLGVMPNCECAIDENKIYDFELERVLKVFDKVESKKPLFESKKEKANDVSEETKFEGGIK